MLNTIQNPRIGVVLSLVFAAVLFLGLLFVLAPAKTAQAARPPYDGIVADMQAEAIDSNGNGKIQMGDSIRYTTTITNEGVQVAKPITVDHPMGMPSVFGLIPFLEIDGASIRVTKGITAFVNGATYYLSTDLGELQPGERVTITFSGRITSNANGGPLLTTAANIYGATATDWHTLIASSNATGIPVVPLLSMQLNVSQYCGLLSIRSRLECTVYVVNSNSFEMPSAVLTVTPPINTQFDVQNSTPGNWNCSGTTGKSACVFSIDTLATQESRAITLGLKMIEQPLNLVANGIMTVALDVFGSEGPLLPYDAYRHEINVGFRYFNIAMHKGLRLVHDAGTPQVADPGDTLEFFTTITNTGIISISNIDIHEYFPSYLAFGPPPPIEFVTETLTTTLGSALAPTPLAWAVHLDQLLPAQVVTTRGQIKVKEHVPFQVLDVRNVAQVTQAGGDGNSLLIESDTVTVPLAKLADAHLNVQGPTAIVNNGAVHSMKYDIFILNTGKLNVENSVLTATLPGHTVLSTTASTQGWQCAALVCTFAVGTLAPDYGYPWAVQLVFDASADFPSTQNKLTTIFQVGFPNDTALDTDLSNNMVTSTANVSRRANVVVDLKIYWLEDSDNDHLLSATDALSYVVRIENRESSVVTDLALYHKGSDWLLIDNISTTAGILPSQMFNSGLVFMNRLEVGMVVTVTYRGRLNPSLYLSGPFSLALPEQRDNAIQLVSGAGDQFDSNVIPIRIKPIYNLGLVGNASLFDGGLASFALMYANWGAPITTGLVITAQLSSQAEISSALSTPGWQCQSNVCRFVITNSVAARESGYVYLIASLKHNAPADVDTASLVAEIGSIAPLIDVAPSDNIVTATSLIGSPPQISLTTQYDIAVDGNGDGKLSLNDRARITIKIRNSEQRSARKFSLTNNSYGLQIFTDTIQVTPNRPVQTEQNDFFTYIGLGDLPAGESLEVSFLVKMLYEVPITQKTVVNTIFHQDQYGLQSEATPVAIPVFHATDAALDVQVQFSVPAEELTSHDLITITAVATNTGEETLYDAALVNDLADCLVIDANSITTTRGTVRLNTGNPIYVALGQFPKGVSVRLTYTAHISDAAYCPTRLRMSVRSDVGYITISNEREIPLVQVPDLRLGHRVSANSIVRPGDIVPLGFDVYHYYGYTASHVVMTEVVPLNTRFNAKGSLPTVWSCPDGSPPGTVCVARATEPSVIYKTLPFTFAVQLDAAIPPSIYRITNTAQVGDLRFYDDPEPYNNAANLMLLVNPSAYPIQSQRSAYLVKDNDGDGKVGANDEVDEQLVLTNVGNTPLGNFSITDYRGGGYFYVYGSLLLTATSPITVVDTSFQYSSIELAASSLAPGDKITVSYRLGVIPSGPLTEEPRMQYPFGEVRDLYGPLAHIIPSVPLPTRYYTDITPSANRITIIVDALPDSIQNFHFGGSLGAFSLDDTLIDDNDDLSRAHTFDVQPGSYVISEAVPATWELGDIFCNTRDGIVIERASKQVRVQVRSNQEQVFCTFVNLRTSNIWAYAFNDRNRDGIANNKETLLPAWPIALINQQSGQSQSKQTAGDGRSDFDNIESGRFKVCEIVQVGWQVTRPSITDTKTGLPCYWLTITPGKIARVFFGNTLQTTISAFDPAQPPTFTDVLLQSRPDVPYDEAGYSGDYSEPDTYVVGQPIPMIYLPIAMQSKPSIH